MIELGALILNNNNLTTIPKNIPPSLNTLVLSHNKISELSNLSQLTNLKKLAIACNQIGAISDALNNNTALTELRLRGNKIVRIPPNIGHNIHLRLVDICNNGIADKRGLQSLTFLHRLRNLSIKGNPVANQPDGIYDWFQQQIPSLKILDGLNTDTKKRKNGNNAQEDTGIQNLKKRKNITEYPKEEGDLQEIERKKPRNNLQQILADQIVKKSIEREFFKKTKKENTPTFFGLETNKELEIQNEIAEKLEISWKEVVKPETEKGANFKKGKQETSTVVSTTTTNSIPKKRKTKPAKSEKAPAKKSIPAPNTEANANIHLPPSSGPETGTPIMQLPDQALAKKSTTLLDYFKDPLQNVASW